MINTCRRPTAIYRGDDYGTVSMSGHTLGEVSTIAKDNGRRAVDASAKQITSSTHDLKLHPDPFSHFATVHFPGRQTDRQTDSQTDRWVRRQAHTMERFACYADKERRANIIEVGLRTLYHAH